MNRGYAVKPMDVNEPYNRNHGARQRSPKRRIPNRRSAQRHEGGQGPTSCVRSNNITSLEKEKRFTCPNRINNTVDTRKASVKKNYVSSDSSSDGSSSSERGSRNWNYRTNHYNSKPGNRRRRDDISPGNAGVNIYPDVRQAVAMDCEMVGTGPDGLTSALARVSLVDWYGRILLDTYVKVREQVTDMRTFVSGITWDKIDPSSSDAMELSDCVSLVQRLIHGRILVGHALENDLKVLQITHPWYAVRDTATYEPFMRAHGEMLLPRRLKDLSYEKLGLVIQNSANGHSSIEDAWAAMKLYNLSWPHWETLADYRMRHALKMMSRQNIDQTLVQRQVQQQPQHQRKEGLPVVIGCS